MEHQHPALVRLRYAGRVLAAVGVVALAFELWRVTQGASPPWTDWTTAVLHVVTGLYVTRVGRTTPAAWARASYALAGTWALLLVVKAAGRTV